MTRPQLIQLLQTYSTSYLEEKAFVKPFLLLLDHPRGYFRDHLPGHITGSAWIVNETRSKVLLVLHAKLERWLQPGGHADGDENVLNVALREAREETGLDSLKLLTDSLFDIDIHKIPARKDFPEHLHYDIRFLLQTREDALLTISDESKDMRWIALENLKSVTRNNLSIMRMAAKTINFAPNAD